MAFSFLVPQFVCILLFHFHFHFQANCLPSLSPNTSSSTVVCNPDQSHALLLFKKSFSIRHRPPYHLISSYPKTNTWKEGTDCCLWDGISCDHETGYVIGLDVSYSMLYGSIHSDNHLFFLSHLQKLDLSNNNFNRSQISPHFGYFFNLMYLDLSLSNFVGQVPSQISQLSNLVSLDLSRNDELKLDNTAFVKIAQNLSYLRELELSFVNLSLVETSSFLNLPSSLSYLGLWFCGLQGNFPDIFHLSKLVSLVMSRNSNLTMDAIIFNKLVQSLPNLTELHLDGLNLSSVEPSCFLNLSSSLISLSLWGCGLHGEFPGNLIQRPNLQLLYLSSNGDLNASLPMSNWSSSLQALDLSHTKIQILLQLDFFNNFKSLKQLYLSGCQFVGSNLDLLGNLTQLSELDLSDNNFSGQIPSTFQNLQKLVTLNFSYSNLNGHIPNYFANFTQLEFLHLSDNRLTGPIPSLPLPNLYFLALSNNWLTGPIPSILPPNLSLLFLSNNLLNGTIPSSLSTLTQLESVHLYNNQLHGPIPSFQSNFLAYIILGNNMFHGPIPSFQSSYLTYIDLGSNMLHGTIPDFNIINLEVLILSSNNKLTGEVSSSLCNLRSLRVLDLSNNSLSGFIPSCLEILSNSLSVFHFGINNFQGTISNTFSESCQLRYLNFKGNYLQGQIPPSISNCKDLEFVDLSNNKIDDEFPYFFGILPHLQVLVIHSNKFHGLVKGFNDIYSFPNLRIFDISNNSFNGPLPTEYFDHFESMVNTDHVLNYMIISTRDYNYTYSVRLMVKGLEIMFPKIQNILTTIDLSKNKFTGVIPHSIGKLKALKQLNLSHNSLIGNIPQSMSNLSNLESLDLSSNLLSGRIPMQLANLTFLEVFRVSYNRLEGPIPQGKQFGTFDNSSYEGNLGLCGFPLEKCNNVKPQAPLEQDDSDNSNGFGWKAVVIGYGCGTIFGLVMGYLVFTRKKPAWFVRMVEGEGNRRSKGFKKKKRKSHGRRN